MNKIQEILVRYFLIIILSAGNLYLFYSLFSPITIYPVFFFLDIVFNAELFGHTILVENVPIILINACIAGSAYYLLLFLNLSTPGIKIIKRVGFILLSFLIFLLLNIIRILILSVMAIKGNSHFYITHILFWYLLSTIFVVLIWFFLVKFFKVKNVPFYSDLKTIYSIIKR